MSQVSITVHNNSPIIIYFALDWDGGGHIETNRFDADQSHTLAANVPDGSTVSITIYKLIVGWEAIWTKDYAANEVPSCLKVHGINDDVSTC